MPNSVTTAIRQMSGARFLYRPGTSDEEVLSPDYQRGRFFPPGYRVGAAQTIIDVGAHIGAFAVVAAQQAIDGVVYAVEPSRESFAILVANVALNGLTNVRPIRTALSGASGPAVLYHATENWAHSLTIREPGTDGGEPVLAMTLETFLAEHSLSHVDFLKMNAEGAEYGVLLTARRAVLGVLSAMLIECHPVDGRPAEEIVDRLRESGFVVQTDWSYDEPGKGWITATRSPLGA